MKNITEIPYNKIINSLKFHDAIVRYVYLMQNKNTIDEIYELVFCELYDLTPRAMHIKENVFVEFKDNYFKKLKQYISNPSLMPNIDGVIDQLKTKNHKKDEKVFASKLMHTVEPQTYPVWDKYVCNKHHYKQNMNKTKKKTFNDRYIEYIGKVKDYCIANRTDADTMIYAFNNNPKYQNLPIQIEGHKIIDFILWQDR